MTDVPRKIVLPDCEMPGSWYNLQADLPEPLPPPLHPGTGQPMPPEMLEVLFARELIAQEISSERWIAIPEEVQQIYHLWRPTPLVRAKRLEAALRTPAEIYYKNESVNPTGSHKLNTAVAQTYYNKLEGIKQMTTETGAGQWGSAMALAGAYFDMPVRVYMVKCSYEQKPYRRMLIETWGAEIFASPSNRTKSGRDHLSQNPDSPGSLGLAISEAVEEALADDSTHYCLGSVLNHVCLHQTVIGEEAQLQMAHIGRYPDVVIGCVGGGSNFAGLSFPYVRDKIREGRKTRIVAVEPAACPSITRGRLAYDHGDMACFTPLLYMHTLGHGFMPKDIHAGGLRYHGMAPLVSHISRLGLIEAVSCYQNPVFEAAVLFARTEGIVPAPETAHAVRAAIDEAVKCRETGEKKVILFNFSGHGAFDLVSYDKYHSGKLPDFELPDAELQEALKSLPKQP